MSGRPERGAAIGGVRKKTGNPFSDWYARRKERQRQAEDQAAKTITDDTAKNVQCMIDELQGIDFLHSRLPKAILDHKSSEKQSRGDLENAAMVIAQMLRRSPLVKMDIRPIDEKLLTLVLLFQEAVEQGDEAAAYAAKAALIRGVKDIRGRIPENQKTLAQQFVKVNAKYLEDWIVLVKLAQATDRVQQDVAAQRLLYESSMKEVKEQKDNLQKKIETDPDNAEAFAQIIGSNMPELRTDWTEVQRAVYRMMIDMRMAEARLKLNDQMLLQQEDVNSVKKAQLDALFARLATLKVVEDPDLMNQFQQQVDEMFTEMAARDAEIDETLQVMEDIVGRLEQMDNAPGAIRARETAQIQALKLAEELQKKQEQSTKDPQTRIREALESVGMHTEEELALERERIQQEQHQQMMEQAEELEQEEQFLYND